MSHSESNGPKNSAIRNRNRHLGIHQSGACGERLSPPGTDYRQRVRRQVEIHRSGRFSARQATTTATRPANPLNTKGASDFSGKTISREFKSPTAARRFGNRFPGGPKAPRNGPDFPVERKASLRIPATRLPESGPPPGKTPRRTGQRLKINMKSRTIGIRSRFFTE